MIYREGFYLLKEMESLFFFLKNMQQNGSERSEKSIYLRIIESRLQV
jgi:hypothetical protein